MFRATGGDGYSQSEARRWNNTALEGFDIRQGAGHQSVDREIDWDEIPIFIFGLAEVESPEQTREVKINASLGDM